MHKSIQSFNAKPHTSSAARESSFLALSLSTADLQNVLRVDAASTEVNVDGCVGPLQKEPYYCSVWPAPWGIENEFNSIFASKSIPNTYNAMSNKFSWCSLSVRGLPQAQQRSLTAITPLKILLHHTTSGLPDATPLGLERAALVLLIVSIQNKKHDILSYLINPERAVRFVNINVWRKRKGRRSQSYS